ncbi:MAG: hypothetical protein CM15mP40_11940 [Alphaproteobacteria bacterium]|nr:MAG: hypothetical protein CM15mP40_11940 [Alphaproteobacteria bacterium]
MIPINKNKKSSGGKYIEIKGANGNNLKNINVRFPLKKFISITGVSGGGKSTLIIETLFKSLSKKNQ